MSDLPQLQRRSSGTVGWGPPNGTIPVGIMNGILSTWAGQLVRFSVSSRLPASPAERNGVWKKLKVDLSCAMV